MSDQDIQLSLGKIHDRINDLVDVVGATREAVVRMEEKQVNHTAAFIEHKDEYKAKLSENDEKFSKLEDRADSMEKSRDRVRWVMAPFIVGSTSIAAMWDRIIKGLGIN